MLKLIIPILIFISGCVPVNSTFDSARMLDAGVAEVRGSASIYNYTENESTDISNYNYGFGAGYGVNNFINIKMRYELITFPENSEDRYHYFDISFKHSIIHDKIAVSLPLGVYAADGAEPVYVISPRLFFTWPFSDQIEVMASAKTDFFFEEDADIPFGFNVGLGLSKDLNLWALRPEIGYMIDPGETGSSFTYGIGLIANFKL